ncbi:MAG: hypothetical protein C4583_12765 [Anaerolineaceae bacterium]|nr:MAG: hypothetical protein C4583_12765 [Anaerolineaceae bacterium]
MDKKTVGIIATVLSALACGCAAIISCAWGVIGVTGTPINITSGGDQYVDTMSPTVGYVLLCLSVLFVAVPVVVGFVTLRKKRAPIVDNEPIPPAS